MATQPEINGKTVVFPKEYTPFPIGTPGKPWGEEERTEWLLTLKKVRDYFGEITSPFMRFDFLDIFSYGEIDYRDKITGSGNAAFYPLFAARNKDWDPSKPLVVISSGNHGYELTYSGLHYFLNNHYCQEFEGKCNFLIFNCLSPFGIEYNERWTANAVDPNRSFGGKPGVCQCEEARLFMKTVVEESKKCAGILAHFDLHETTLSDFTTFCPAKIARDGETDLSAHEIPRGYYSVGVKDGYQPEFQKEIIEAVRKVTPIAPADEDNKIIGEIIVEEGIIAIEGRKWNICGAFTSAPYAVTTEIFPDMEGCTRLECDQAQSAVIVAGLSYALAHPLPSHTFNV